ncbi:MAG: zinc ribbon domain-containing protein, partial [Bacteroidaceae bacterium]|nr:zinc ribbon domain-containing protein [Bacteroidaceae bacterium]
QQAQQAYAQQPYTQPQPQYAPVYTEEPISTGAYIGIFFLLMLPVINIILLIVWACGGCNKKNKTNLSRALLVWMLIGVLIGGIIALAGGLLFGDSINELMELGKEISNT